MDEKTYAALSRLATEWNKAEGLMKLSERIRAEVVFPSVNELRYAGRRVVDAWAIVPRLQEDEARQNFDTYIKDAIFRCHCAQHDAVDAAILFVQSTLQEYEHEFGLAAVFTHFPEVADLKARLKEADELIVSSRQDRGKRSTDYDQLAAGQLPEIILTFNKIVSSREALEKLVAEKNERDRRDKSRFRGGIAWNAVFLVAGIVLTLFVTIATPAITKAVSKGSDKALQVDSVKTHPQPSIEKSNASAGNKG